MTAQKKWLTVGTIFSNLLAPYSAPLLLPRPNQTLQCLLREKQHTNKKEEHRSSFYGVPNSVWSSIL
jgi:hypothetical protein